MKYSTKFWKCKYAVAFAFVAMIGGVANAVEIDGDAFSGGALTENTTVLISDGSVVQVSTPTSGAFDLTLALKESATSGVVDFTSKTRGSHTGATNVGSGVTLRLSGVDHQLRTTGVHLDKNAKLEIGIHNATGYILDPNSFLLQQISMAGGSEIFVTEGLTSAHANLGKISVSGTGNKISSTTYTSSHGSFLLAGAFVLGENAELLMETASFNTLRRSDAARSDYGQFDIGAGATLTVQRSEQAAGNIFKFENSSALFIKMGAGTMNVYGNIVGYYDKEDVSVQDGVLNVTGDLSIVNAVVSGGTFNLTGGLTGSRSSGAMISITDGGVMNWTGVGASTRKQNISISGTGSALRINTTFATQYVPTITVENGGVLELAVVNALGLASSNFTDEIVLDGGEISNVMTTGVAAASRHVNLPHLTISGTGNVLSGSISGTYGTYFLAGKVTLEENAEAIFSATTITLRNGMHALTGSGTFDIGKGATLNITSTVRLADNSTPTLTKLGTGTMLVGGTLTGAGGVDVQAGRLIISGAHTYAGGTTLQSGATLALSAREDTSIALKTLTLGSNLTLDGRLQVNLSGANADLISITGDLSIGGDFILDLNWLEEPTADEYTLATATGKAKFLEAAAAIILEGEYSNLFTASLTANSLILTRENEEGGGGGEVPEPATWISLLLGVSIGALALKRRAASAQKA
ncbi:MAG: PEP-CTERM sorting domain-containing protein [Planctomycetia bacterium]|nr:PEP-CTERM sorting domain-containing protein [Planctomycetia bacterium]